MAMTYDSLKAQILSYLIREDQDTQDQVPNFIYQAHQKICTELKSIGIEKYVTGTFVGAPGSASSVIPKPARWRRSISFNFGTGVGNNTRNPILLRTYEFLRSYWPDATQSGPPKYYSDYGFDHLLVAPTPDQNYPFEYAYLELPDPLSATNQTNWLTNYAPNLLLYASLLESTPWIQSDERIAVWQGLYDRQLKALSDQDDARQTDRSANRNAD